MPTFSIVTPSYNQAQFIEATLASVERQSFRDYEHLIFDPGSQDASCELIEAYVARNRDRAHFYKGEDRSQTNAINLGFSRARGDILCWLNSDDEYYDEDALAAVASAFVDHPTIDVVYGEGVFIDVGGAKMRDAFINRDPQTLFDRFLVSIGILQPSLFMRKRAFEMVGPLDESLNFSFDYEYWVRLLFAGNSFLHLPRKLSRATIHDGAKTMSQRGKSLRECELVAKQYFGFVPKEWADRAWAFEKTGTDGIITTSTEELTAASYCDRYGTPSAILTWAHLASSKKTLEAIADHPALAATRRIVTCFDAAYFDQGLTLIASIRRQNHDVAVLVYDNGLSTSQRALVNALANVFVIDFPADLIPGDWYRKPKNYVYKNLIAYHTASLAPEGALILWMDAGVATVGGISELFGLIQDMGAFFINHDDRPSYPLYNATFATDESLLRMRTTVGEASAEHICSCLFGYVNTARYRQVFAEGYRLSCDPLIALGDKHPNSGTRPPSDEAASNRTELLSSGPDAVIDVDLLRRLREVFGFFGHRQDQTVFSCLVARHKLPIVSAKRYCASSDASSKQSKLNYLSGAVAPPTTEKLGPGDFGDAVTVHHRGLLTDFEGLHFADKAPGEACAILGNGPSLRGFDLRSLGKLPAIGMNAAYRHWEGIGWYPTYYACLDLVVGDSHREQILELIKHRRELGIALFLLREQLITSLQEQTDLEAVVNFDLLCHGSPLLAVAPITTGSHSAAFACLLGYKRLYLLGIDCNYVEKVRGARSLGGAVLELTHEEGNPNYFFDGYQRTGDRFNVPNPNPDLHIRAWRQVACAVSKTDARIFNTNLASKVVDFEPISIAEFMESEGLSACSQKRTSVNAADKSSVSTLSHYPRLLLVDHTCIGDPSATGQLKANLFSGWPPARVMQVYDAGAGEVRLKCGDLDTDVSSLHGTSADDVQQRAREFQPDVILYRPMPDTEGLHRIALGIISASDAPLATWIVDDWPTALERARPDASIGKDWRQLLEKSWLNFAIGEAMSDAFRERYGHPFQTIANGIDSRDWPEPPPTPSHGAKRVRYAGSLAEDMTLSSVLLVAEAVEDIARDGLDIVFEIKTRDIWFKAAAHRFAGLTRTRFITQELPPSEYRRFLSEADIVLIAYNFDEATSAYARYSIANKLPECLACGAPLLAIGPRDFATLQVLERFECGIRIFTQDLRLIKNAIVEFAEQPAARLAYAQKARKIAFDHFNIEVARAEFARALSAVADSSRFNFGDIPRLARASVDEAAVVAQLLGADRGRSHVMFDVGAHTGGSAQHFHKLDWTIYCFEPDVVNREKLGRRFHEMSNVVIDPRALSDRPLERASFFTSPESSGISSLHPFRPTHRESDRVQVTTVADVTATRGIEGIDFLKIDVEGLDFSVLRGVPWDRLRPRVVMCEFEDAKTAPLGHDWRDICRYLRSKGYFVYVSEWHPVTRYGITHDWRRVFPYSATDVAVRAWGNIIALRTDPGFSKVRSTFRDLVRIKRKRQGAILQGQAPHRQQTAGRAPSPPSDT
ncbi:MAG: FkbM family methyltransferase [Terricaulis sp.]